MSNFTSRRCLDVGDVLILSPCASRGWMSFSQILNVHSVKVCVDNEMTLQFGVCNVQFLPCAIKLSRIEDSIDKYLL